MLAAAIGLGFGGTLNIYTASLFAPALIKEFGWARSEFALVGTLSLFTLPLIPLAGRFTDRFKSRIAAIVGFTALPLAYLAFSFMSGAITQFFAITVVFLCLGLFTMPLVFCRIIVEHFDRARGVALSLAMTGTPLAGALVAPFLGHVIEVDGWRAGYRLLALLCAAGGLTAIVLMGKERMSPVSSAPRPGLTRADLLNLFRDPVFGFLIAGMFLCNLPQVLASSQLKLVLMDSGAASQVATWMVSLYAVSVLIGRFACGIALDRVAVHKVAVLAIGLPALGFIALASSLDAVWLFAGAILLIGLAQGAEGDIGAFLVSRKFDLRNYSLILSFITVTLGAATALGSVVLSATLRESDSFSPFLWLSAGMTVAAAVMFYLTGYRRKPSAHREVPGAAAE